jgi:hypothetical protein
MADKHKWEKSCFYDGKDLSIHLIHIIEQTACCDIIGLPVKAIIIREYIPMDTKFTAFMGKMPIGAERRYFIKDGKTIEHFPYWTREPFESEITRGYPWAKYPDNWPEILNELNNETPEEIKLLTSYANKIAQVLDGYWSVDFCRAKDGRWVFIDVAEGEKSWHPILRNY